MLYHLLTTKAALLIISATRVPYAMCLNNETRSPEFALQEELFKTYNRHIKPVKDYSKIIPLGIKLYILSLQELDMKSQTLHTATWLEVFWKDEYLAWNSSEFSDIQYLRLPADKVWVPSICNIREISGKRCVTYGSVADTSSEVSVDSSGQVVLGEGIQSIIMCAFNTQKFPFDTQTCEFEFFPTNYFIHGIHIIYNQSKLITEYFAENGEWNLVSSNMKMDVKNIIKMCVVLRRRPLFLTLSLVFPIVALSIMNAFCFLLPIESGEKMGLSVALFLTFAVFGSILSDSMPQNSENISLFVVYVTIQIFLSGVSVVMETVVLRVYYTEVCSSLPKPACVRGKSIASLSDDPFDKSLQKMKDLDRSNSMLHGTRMNHGEKWKTRARRLDKILLLLNVLTNIVTICIFASFLA
ncbi:5-hydroxytryptamine receptor 3A-like [Crassostrea angulata]|uniref:5-hydroxytryptamine receptor 3A-like n=1 Tax=Magallana angulata TaxID=2784310 RepID=UPI0022B1E518|nr:5-hydroxytryptamine receptor 3A-like [Crassostrea angulata]